MNKELQTALDKLAEEAFREYQRKQYIKELIVGYAACTFCSGLLILAIYLAL